MRKFLAVATALGLLAMSVPMQASAQTTATQPKATTTVPGAVTTTDAKAKPARVTRKATGKIRYARHQRRMHGVYGYRAVRHARHHHRHGYRAMGYRAGCR
jgi:hypothetical protein